MKQILTMAIVFSLASALPAFAHGDEPHDQSSAKKTATVTSGKTLALKLSGLHCAGCAMSIQTRLLKVAGVASVVVSPEKQTATVVLAKGAKRPTDAVLMDAVKRAGYKCVSVKG